MMGKLQMNKNHRQGIKKLYITSLALILSLPLLLSCSKKKDPYKEGETVTWKFHDKLIIKAKVGERRTHIVDENCPKCERDSYRPQAENYLGQFPIDYQPQAFDKITADKARSMEYTRFLLEKPFEFNLMLNGSWVEATDRSIYLKLDHPDQVKVVIEYPIGRFKKEMTTKEAFYNKYSIKKLDINSATERYGMTCYRFIDNNETSKSHRCFGQSSKSSISGFNVLITPALERIDVDSHEKEYGNMVINWYFHPKNLNQIQYIEKNTYRLLDTWNISPIH